MKRLISQIGCNNLGGIKGGFEEILLDMERFKMVRVNMGRE